MRIFFFLSLFLSAAVGHTQNQVLPVPYGEHYRQPKLLPEHLEPTCATPLIYNLVYRDVYFNKVNIDSILDTNKPERYFCLDG